MTMNNGFAVDEYSVVRCASDRSHRLLVTQHDVAAVVRIGCVECTEVRWSDVASIAWYDSHKNLTLLLAWLGDMSPSGFRDVVKEPWAYESEWETAKAALAHEADTGHEVWHDGQSDTVAYCNDEDCGWRVDHGVVTAVEAVLS